MEHNVYERILDKGGRKKAAKGKKVNAKKGAFNNPLTLGENAIQVLEKRYLKKDLDGTPVETPAELFKRVSLKNVKMLK